nr:D-3-phosphoglycerate dehydrogenase 1, chloroplastic-like [Tanacetum cinerariifolium]
MAASISTLLTPLTRRPLPLTRHPTRRHAPSHFTPRATLTSKPTILVAEQLGEAGIELLKQFANVDCSYEMSDEELKTKISLCDALIVRSGTNVSREVFESSGGRLKVVGRAGVGIDNVDVGWRVGWSGRRVRGVTRVEMVAAIVGRLFVSVCVCVCFDNVRRERGKMIDCSCCGHFCK